MAIDVLYMRSTDPNHILETPPFCKYLSSQYQSSVLARNSAVALLNSLACLSEDSMFKFSLSRSAKIRNFAV